MGLAISRRENKRIACLINGITTRHIACSVENVGCLQGSMFQKMATIDSKRLKELGFTDFQIYVLKYLNTLPIVATGTYELERSFLSETLCVMGHSCVDVNLLIPFSFDFFSLKRLAVQLFKFIKDLPSPFKGKWLSLMSDWWYLRPSLESNNWFFVVSSVDTFKMDFIDDAQNKNKKMTFDQQMDLIEKLTHQDLIGYAEKNGYVKASEGLWVSKNDPTVMFFDTEVFPYDLVDGWSNKKVAKLLEVWWVSVVISKYKRFSLEELSL